MENSLSRLIIFNYIDRQKIHCAHEPQGSLLRNRKIFDTYQQLEKLNDTIVDNGDPVC